MNPVRSSSCFVLFLVVLLLNGCGFFGKVTLEPSKYEMGSWSDLNKIPDADLVAGYQAWLASCPRLIKRKAAVWSYSCGEATLISSEDPEVVRGFLRENFTLLQLVEEDTSVDGLITGYYEPIYDGRLEKQGPYQHPVHGVPDDLIRVDLGSLFPELKGKRVRGKVVGNRLVPYPDRDELVAEVGGTNAEVIAWLANPMDVEFLQIQGSGRVALENGELLRVGYADQNGHPYRPVGRWLLQNEHLPREAISMQSIRQWADDNPAQVDEMLDSNPSYVFFRKLPDKDEGPIGSLGVPLTAGYSLAVDRRVTPLGSMMILDTNLPVIGENPVESEESESGVPVRRLVTAQDTGGAINGTVRADLFVGTGDEAGQIAGLMKQKGRLWVLWPKTRPLPEGVD